jgi:Spy/CpxP family protein refolding chaperone
MLNPSKLWASLLLAGTFVAGATVGGVGVSVVRERRDDRRPAERTERERQGGRERMSFTGQLTRELNLTETQRDTVRAILKRYDPAMRSVMESARPAVDSLRRLIHADIEQVLTAEQREAFRQWSARMDSLTQMRRQRDQKEKEKGRAR